MLDRYYDAVDYMDLNASYTFGKKIKCEFPETAIFFTGRM